MARMAPLSLLLVCLSSGCALTALRDPLADRVVPCPCDLNELGRLAAENPTIVITRDRDRSTRHYHPGARVAYRIFDPETDPIAGNQCSYDEQGRLITSGPAAGTPDYVSPERSVLGHWLFDVRPFRRLGWFEYHRRGWAPIAAPAPIDRGATP